MLCWTRYGLITPEKAIARVIHQNLNIFSIVLVLHPTDNLVCYIVHLKYSLMIACSESLSGSKQLGG